jgi:hypothetical protein
LGLNCDVCVLGSSCDDVDICRFGWCRCCGGRLSFFGRSIDSGRSKVKVGFSSGLVLVKGLPVTDVQFNRWVFCSRCGFTNRPKRVRRLRSFG